MPAQPNPRASWPSHDDNGGFFLIISFIGIAILAVLLWINQHGMISSLVMTFYHYQIAVLHHLTNRFDVADGQMAAANPESVRITDLYGIAHDVGTFFRIPVAALMLILGFVCMVRAAPSRFKRNLDLDGLIKEQALAFPVAHGFAGRHLKLVAPSRELRPLDYALTPQEWVERYATRPDDKFDETEARRCLSLQLGPRWCGVETAAPHIGILFAAFALHLAERRDQAGALLGTAALSIASAGGDTPDGPEALLTLPAAVSAAAAEAIEAFEVSSPASRIAAGHAYAHTALMALLNASRLKAGVLAPSQFVWLKLVDRPLWYALHSLGFETESFARYLHPNPRIEAAGVRDHWAVERLAGRPLIRPEVDRALAALRKVMEQPSP